MVRCIPGIGGGDFYDDDDDNDDNGEDNKDEDNHNNDDNDKNDNEMTSFFWHNKQPWFDAFLAECGGWFQRWQQQ